ncbi:DgyrCDS13084 [Dimorphilus gyrociliatus]|uniref:Beta-1,4-galactosyltransferase n=1 Tax=Dimorphilus gyrociliatus TaxID=2664684 RepID=A0A7I8W9P1_9ANNE|nr:DgyrCDS13084 [Dimorphilus gyrociliatus]
MFHLEHMEESRSRDRLTRKEMFKITGQPKIYQYQTNTLKHTNKKVIEKRFWSKDDAEVAMAYYKNTYLKTCNIFMKRLANKSSICDCDPKLKGHKAIVDYNVRNYDWVNIDKKHLNIHLGGEFKPSHCNAIQKIAIVIPYRDRMEHLKILVNHLHKVLPKQNIHYKIFVIEQSAPLLLNKGAIMNIGYLVAQQYFVPDCIIFHDVDMLLEDKRHMYNCIQSPRHMGAHVDKFNYTQLYKNVGGVFAIKPHQFRKVNGYHILFYGWGDEDMDMLQRLLISRLIPVKWPVPLSRYSMIKHSADVFYPKNQFRKSFLMHESNYHKLSYRDYGLSKLKYGVNWIKKFFKALNSFYKVKGSCLRRRQDKIGQYSLIVCVDLCLEDEKCKGFVFNAQNIGPCLRLMNRICDKDKLQGIDDTVMYIKKNPFY